MTEYREALTKLLSLSGEFADESVDLSEATFARCSGGYSHDNFHVSCNLGEFALRIRRSAPPEPWNEQRFLQAWAQPLGPALVAWDDTTGNLLTTWCTWLKPSRTNPPSIAHCRALLASLERLPTTSDELPTYPLRAQVYGWLRTASDRRGLAQVANTPDLPGPYRICHNDLNSDNLLYREGRWLVLDWEWAGLNSPTFDAATLAADLPSGCASLAQLTPNVSPDIRNLAWRWFCLREYAYAVNALAVSDLDQATTAALIEQRNRYAGDPALSLK